VAQPPVVSRTGVHCSYGNRTSGRLSLAIGNPSDGAGAATYAVTVASRAVDTTPVADGSSILSAVSGLPAGTSAGRISGSDGSTAAFSVRVPTCPAYQGVRVQVRRVSAHRVRIRLDNARNATATGFRVKVGGVLSRHRVAGGAVRIVHAAVHGSTRVRVYVGRHLVAHAG
jgi:hypothetical protein